MWPHLQFPEEILNGKLHFLCSGIHDNLHEMHHVYYQINILNITKFLSISYFLYKIASHK